MNSTLDCVPCFVEHALHVAKMSTEDESAQLDIVRQTLALVAEMDFSTTPPEMARRIHSIIREVTGVDDAYLELKDESTRFALKILPLLRDEIAISENPFETIIRFVIAGNIIDFGADRHFDLKTAHQRITETLSLPMDLDALKILKSSMDEAKSILYILDNCGEAVLDRFLIEKYADKITIGVRGGPILNDITMREISMSGLDNLAASIIDTGDRTPGVSQKHSSDEFLDAMKKADLIISKGQGNFETLSDISQPIIFLLRTKCPVIARKIGNELGSLNIIPHNIG